MLILGISIVALAQPPEKIDITNMNPAGFLVDRHSYMVSGDQNTAGTIAPPRAAKHKSSNSLPQVLTCSYGRMLDNAWKWTGTYRQTERKIGCDPGEIVQRIPHLLAFGTTAWLAVSLDLYFLHRRPRLVLIF